MKSIIRTSLIATIVTVGLLPSNCFCMNTENAQHKLTWDRTNIATTSLDRIIELPWAYFDRLNPTKKIETINKIQFAIFQLWMV